VDTRALLRQATGTEAHLTTELITTLPATLHRVVEVTAVASTEVGATVAVVEGVAVNNH
jgi:hypothetical protein